MRVHLSMRIHLITRVLVSERVVRSPRNQHYLAPTFPSRAFAVIASSAFC
jgi:hypothetical protein